MLLCALTLALLSFAGGSGVARWLSDVQTPICLFDECATVDDVVDVFDLSDELSYDAPVLRAEKVVRPLRSLKAAYGPISHSGVRVTLEDGSQWLIHKGHNDGASSPTVVTSAEHMSSKWKTEETREINGRKTVADFVKAGGDAYDVRRANCHHATDAMINQ